MQCSRSVTFWYGSGSSDPYLWLTDPDPAFFVRDLKDAKNKFFFTKFLCLFLFESTFTSFNKDNKSERSHKTIEIKIFLHFLLVNGRIRNRIRISINKLRIRIRMQIRIRNTAVMFLTWWNRMSWWPWRCMMRAPARPSARSQALSPLSALASQCRP